jgi:small subunit ribosomal protein S16
LLTDESNPEDANVPVTIRLKRIGSNKNPVFRLVAMDQRKGANKGRVEVLGTVNPRAKEPTALNLKKERIEQWVRQGALVSTTAGQILKKLGVDIKTVKASAN